MKYLCILIAALFVQPTDSRQECAPPLTKDYIEQSLEIAIVSINEDSFRAEGVVSRVVKVFKGSMDVDLFFYLSDESFSFDEPGKYLVYAVAKPIRGVMRITVDKCSRTKRVESAQADLDYLAANIACLDSSLLGEGACTREYIDHICGCDGNEYHNVCEMQKRKGVAVYSYEPCH
jgi:hypothetical protein